MKILHSEASCGWGGQEIRILEEARGLLARGHDVSLVCPAQSRIFAEAGRFGVPVTALPIGRKRLPGLLALRAHLLRHKPDVVNVHSSTDSWLTALACATLRRPPAIVRTRHISLPVAVNWRSRWLFTRASEHIVTTGESLRQALLHDFQLAPDRVSSIATGIDTARFVPGDTSLARQALGLDPHVHYLGIIATLRSWKGHLFLLEAFAALLARRRVMDWRLLIVGEGPMRAKIEAKIAELRLQDRVIMVGQQNEPEQWFRTLDIFCLPSYANEGVPQALMQAMLCGLPIVTTPVGAILEAVCDQQSALVVPPKDATALAKALLALIENPIRAAQLGSQARRYALTRFSLGQMLDAMTVVFQIAYARHKSR
ncbi:MAG: glycosyltransferase family 4 protein [Pseudomonadota bacterium]